MKNLKRYIDNWNESENLVLVTHYVVISEALGYAPSSGEIVIANKKFKKNWQYKNRLLKDVIKESNETSTKTSLC